jgi:hypothetical protein
LSSAVAPEHWIPERLLPVDENVVCEWLDIGDLRFTDPFFEMTLARRRRDRPARRTSTLQQMYDESEALTPLAPSAFIFHVSRCGSTLLAQLFGCDEGAVVLSEVPLLDELLRSNLPERERLFTAALRLLSRRRSGREERLFVKTDAWHIFYAATLRRLYPDTPFILLYRSPEAVLDSHARARGMHMVPGLLERAPFTVAYDPARLTLDQYAAAVLERYYQAMLAVAAADARAALVSYDEGFPAVFERLAAWLGLPLPDGLKRRVLDRCAYDGKNPRVTFSSPSRPLALDVNIVALQQLSDRLEDMRRLSVA